VPMSRRKTLLQPVGPGSRCADGSTVAIHFSALSPALPELKDDIGEDQDQCAGEEIWISHQKEHILGALFLSSGVPENILEKVRIDLAASPLNMFQYSSRPVEVHSHLKGWVLSLLLLPARQQATALFIQPAEGRDIGVISL